MTPQRAVPRRPDADSANNRFKGHFRSIFWTSMILGVVGHFAAFEYWPAVTAPDISYVSAELTAVELPPEIEIPEAPHAIARPATPVIATTMVSEEVTIAPTTFEMNPVEKLPPPPERSEVVEDLSVEPTFTPFTVAPVILNREKIIDQMRSGYPPLLKSAGIGGVVHVFFYIDAEGRVQATRVNRSSGYEQLDQAALQLAGIYRFSPALNRDTRVPVWVSFPIAYQVVN